MYACLTLVVLLCFICPLTTAYTCPQNSQFYIDCSNLYTLNQSIAFCSQYEMNLLNVTIPGAFTLLNQTLELINCTNNFWYSNGDQTGLIANTGSTTGGVVCSIIPLLGLYCISTPIVQAATVCTRTNQIEIQQKCLNDQSNQRFNLQEYTFVRKTIYANKYNILKTRSQSQCNSLCARTDKCIGTNYNQFNCTLYL